MAKSLQEYAAWLDERDLPWPRPPKPEPVKATPYLKPLPGVRAVAWDVYGTLLRISDGKLLFVHPEKVRMEVALDKTVHEFNMWNAMTRKPGAPWEYMLQMYNRVLDEMRLAGSGHRGDFPELNAARIWRKVLGKLEQKEYSYDASIYGNLEQLSLKIAYFYHSSLQGVEAAPHAGAALAAVAQTPIRQGLLADAQPFTMLQLLRALRAQGTLAELGELFDPDLITLTFQEGLRKPSKSFYQNALSRFTEFGMRPEQVLYVASRLKDDLAVAKSMGMRTALYAGDHLSLDAQPAELRDPQLKPDRLLTDLNQIRDILAIA